MNELSSESEETVAKKEDFKIIAQQIEEQKDALMVADDESADTYKGNNNKSATSNLG